MQPAQLLGRWQATVAAQPGPIVLELAPHPEWSGSAKGRILRPGYSSIAVGDVHEGRFSLEESRNGQSVSGAWLGEVVAGSCARHIRGRWSDEDDKEFAFDLHKMD